MARRLRKRFVALLIFLAVILIGPFLVPVETTGTLSNLEAAEAVGARGEFVELNELQLYVERTPFQGAGASQAPLIVLLHGFGASSFSWREVTDDLALLGEVISYDRPAFGFTERKLQWTGTNPYGSTGQLEILSSVIDAYAKNRPVVLVGHSAGGQIAAQFAIDNPDKVQSLVLIAPSILTAGGAPSWLNPLFSVPQIDHLGPLLVSQIATSGEEILKSSWFDQSLITDEIWAGYRAPLQIRNWERAFWEFNRAERKYDVADRISELTQPILLISGIADTIVPITDSTRLADLLENERFAIIPATGHLPHEEDPASVMAEILKNWSFLVENR